MWFDSWSAVGHVVLATVVAYTVVVVMLRVAGNRSVAKMNAFDFVVTVAIGSAVSTTILSRSVPVADGLAAIGALIGLQYVVASAQAHSERVSHVVTGRPAVLFRDGDFDRDLLVRERVTEEEVRAAVRAAGLPSLADVDLVVLETAGAVSVVPRGAGTSRGMAAAPR